ncbi:hypothetical protein EPHNCH_0735 [Anaplasma phagocytophilum str. NCH-1]|uniref:Uncharacterized protein n=1 Tax=Anaplasma phagocytophilum str. NCH-1 TaxID=1359161 RepID=A0A0F3NDK0_ANAPH|nr:hypothetical protein EPHNCH_0735 [Anaplasma phagocytophilum str. NCH-1]
MANIFWGKGLVFRNFKEYTLNMWHLCIMYTPVRYASP